MEEMNEKEFEKALSNVFRENQNNSPMKTATFMSIKSLRAVFWKRFRMNRKVLYEYLRAFADSNKNVHFYGGPIYTKDDDFEYKGKRWLLFSIKESKAIKKELQ